MEEIASNLCVYCTNTLPTRGYYCPSCRGQVKCKSCGDLLEKDALGCVMCGASVIDSVSENNPPTSSRPSAPNKIGFKKQGNSVSLDAELTDLASSYLADTLGLIVTNGAITFRNQNRQANFLNKSQPRSLSVPVVVSSAEKRALGNLQTSNIDSVEEAEILKRIFSYDNDTLKVVDPRLKSSGKLDQAVRLILITLYTYETIGMQQVERAAIMEILKYSKLDSPHAMSWIANAEELIKTDNLLELSVPGREVVRAILAEISDSSVEVGKVPYSKVKPGKGSKKKKGNQSSKTDKDTPNENSNGSKSASSKPSPMTQLEKLINEGFFKERRKIKDIIEHCKVNKALIYKSTDLGSGLARLIQKEQLKRVKNTSDNQYEYYS